MTKREVFKWLGSQGCDIIVKEGVNNTAPPIIVENKRMKTFSFFALPKDDEDVPKQAITKLIKDLGIEPPPKF